MSSMTDERQPLILVVDSDLGKLSSLDSLFGRKGNRVATCSTVTDALKAVTGHDIDLVIIGKLGDEAEEMGLAWVVKERTPATKVLLLNDHPDAAASIAPINPGADDLLCAPYTEEELAQCAGRLLALRRPPRRPGS